MRACWKNRPDFPNAWRQDGSECAALTLLSRLFLKTYANLLNNR